VFEGVNTAWQTENGRRGVPGPMRRSQQRMSHRQRGCSLCHGLQWPPGASKKLTASRDKVLLVGRQEGFPSRRLSTIPAHSTQQ